MSNPIRIVVDAMGGDYAPVETVKGAVDALNENDRIQIIFTGDENAIKTELAKSSYPEDRVRIVHTTQVIETGEPPVAAIQKKKDSSLVVGLNLVHKGEADAFVSSGSTGAVLVGGQVIVKKIRGIHRAPMAPVLPTSEGASLLIDCGANVDPRPQHLVQFAVIGSIYMKHVLGVKNPRVALLNIGAEEEKGDELRKETYPLLKECKDINFVGNIEARDVPKGGADVIVTDAFSGNILLKMYEGVGSVMLHELKAGLTANLKAKIGAALAYPSLKKIFKKFDITNYGGAPLLGVRGLVVKTHGSAKAKEFKNTILQCIAFYDEDVNGKIMEYINAQKSRASQVSADETTEQNRPSDDTGHEA
ncbi:MAG: phosphate acyltransferase PlsX [Eubacteriales bacterium]|jgi:glycerol-3-phosphate acyltransferase PlsX